MPRQLGSTQIRNAHAFLVQAEEEQRTFTLDEFVAGSGWSKATAKSNLWKKLPKFVQRAEGGFIAFGVKSLTVDIFCRFCSQSAALSGDPMKPQHTPVTEGLVIKAREAALAAVQHYNNPTAVFRSGNFVILMIIAYTALFHAIFERDGLDYVERNNDGTARVVGPYYALWDVKHCINDFTRIDPTKYPANFINAMKENIKFFIPLRDMIEHRQMPQLDANIAGHCQAMLMNFEKFLITEFSNYYSLNQSLALALQFSTERPPTTVDALRASHSAEYEDLKAYINDFHTNLPDEIMENPAFALRVWLIPKIAKHARVSDVTIDFVKVDQGDPEQIKALEHLFVAVKPVVREVRNQSYLLPGDVCRRVQKAIGRKFVASAHNVRAWKHHNARPPSGALDPTETNPKYCVYDHAHKSYVYTEDWVNLLISEYSDEAKYNQVFASRTIGNQAQDDGQEILLST